MVDTIIITKGITAWINNTWKKVTGVVFGSGTDEIVALNVVQRDSDGEIVNPSEVEIEFPTGEDALLKDKTLKDIISEDGLDVNIVNGGAGGSEKVVKAEYTETDLVDGIITLTEEASYFEIINKSNDNGLSFTINGVTVTLDKKDVDSKGLPLIYSFGDDFQLFTEIGISGTEPSFKAIVKG